jgi:hypothetical protein
MMGKEDPSRVPYVAQARLWVARKAMSVQTVEVGVSSLLMIAPVRCAPGTAIRIDIPLPGYDRPMPVPAVVARETEVEGEYAWEVTFESLMEGARQALQVFMEQELASAAPTAPDTPEPTGQGHGQVRTPSRSMQPLEALSSPGSPDAATLTEEENEPTRSFPGRKSSGVREIDLAQVEGQQPAPLVPPAEAPRARQQDPESGGPGISLDELELPAPGTGEAQLPEAHPALQTGSQSTVSQPITPGETGPIQPVSTAERLLAVAHTGKKKRKTTTERSSSNSSPTSGGKPKKSRRQKKKKKKKKGVTEVPEWSGEVDKPERLDVVRDEHYLIENTDDDKLKAIYRAAVKDLDKD